MHAEFVITGSELVLGKLIDTNSAYLAGQLQELGIPLAYISIVGDDETRMAEVLRIALARSPLIITSGGLGPTVDDVTREAVASATERPLVFDATLFAQIEAHFTRFGRRMSENNRKQAFIPNGALPIENPVGTAPIYIVESEQGALISLPGVPREMRYLMENTVVPYLRKRFGTSQIIRHCILRTAGMGESVLDATLGDTFLRSANPLVGLNAHVGQVDVRLTATGADEADCAARLAPFETEARTRLGLAIFGTEGSTLEGATAALLAARGLSVATAEAATRGQLAARWLALPPEAQGVYHGGRVAPTAVSLLTALGARPEDDSVDAARALAFAVRAANESDIGLAVVLDSATAQVALGLAFDKRIEGRAIGYSYTTRPEVGGEWGASYALDWLRRTLAESQ